VRSQKISGGKWTKQKKRSNLAERCAADKDLEKKGKKKGGKGGKPRRGCWGGGKGLLGGRMLSRRPHRREKKKRKGGDSCAGASIGKKGAGRKADLSHRGGGGRKPSRTFCFHLGQKEKKGGKGREEA